MRDPELWQKLQAAPITLSDGSDLGVALTHRYQIAPPQVAVLLTEYRRFLYLLAGNSDDISPSPLVDQLWLLHLADQPGWQSYSTEMFGAELHRTRGRPTPERDPAYRRTLALIRAEFDSAPSAEYWPDPDSRAQAGATSLNALFLGLPITALIGIFGGPAWGVVAFALTMVVAVETFIQRPTRTLIPRKSDSSVD